MTPYCAYFCFTYGCISYVWLRNSTFTFPSPHFVPSKTVVKSGKPGAWKIFTDLNKSVKVYK